MVKDESESDVGDPDNEEHPGDGDDDDDDDNEELLPPADTGEVVLPPPLPFCLPLPLKSPIIQTPAQHVSISGVIEPHL